MYLMNCTTLDITYIVNKLSRYTSNPKKDHLNAIISVHRYLRYTIKYGLNYTKYLVIFEGYTVTNLIFNTKDSKSISGFIFTIKGAVF